MSSSEQAKQDRRDGYDRGQQDATAGKSDLMGGLGMPIIDAVFGVSDREQNFRSGYRAGYSQEKDSKK